MNHSDPLKRLLASWSHEPTPAPEFATEVWSRIRSAESAPRLAPIIRFPWALPLAASIAVMLSVAAGTRSALALNHAEATARQAAAYVRSVDPVQMSATHEHLDS